MLRYRGRSSSIFSFCDSHEWCFCVWARGYVCACVRSEQRDTVVRKPLYPYIAHHGKFWNIYGSARGATVLIVVNNYIFFTCLAAAVFDVHQQQQPSKRLGCHGIPAAHRAFSLVSATSGDSPCRSVSVRTCARRVNNVIYTGCCPQT